MPVRKSRSKKPVRNPKTNTTSGKHLSAPSIRRLCRRGGVKRISKLTYEESYTVLDSFLEKIVRDAITYTEHARRKTVTGLDIVYALKRNNHTLYSEIGLGNPKKTKTVAAKTKPA
jgi:histone H4